MTTAMISPTSRRSSISSCSRHLYAPKEAARSPLARVSVLDEALFKVTNERLQLDWIGALLVLPDLSEGDGARTQSGPRLRAL
jgi:hypothetical protein